MVPSPQGVLTLRAVRARASTICGGRYRRRGVILHCCRRAPRGHTTAGRCAAVRIVRRHTKSIRLPLAAPGQQGAMMDLQLAGRRALVTGSTSGIGYAIAQGLAAEGAQVTITGRTDASVQEALARLRQAVPQARVSGIAADCATAEGADGGVRAAARRRYPGQQSRHLRAQAGVRDLRCGLDAVLRGQRAERRAVCAPLCAAHGQGRLGPRAVRLQRVRRSTFPAR